MISATSTSMLKTNWIARSSENSIIGKNNKVDDNDVVEDVNTRLR